MAKRIGSDFKVFCQMAKDYGVYDHDVNTRVYIGNKSSLKFLACSRTEGVKLFFNDREKWLVEKIGCLVHPYASSKSYAFQCELASDKFGPFLGLLQTSLDVNGEAITGDINTPILPKRVIEDPDGSIKFECRRCGIVYLKAPRCPECGQMVKE